MYSGVEFDLVGFAISIMLLLDGVAIVMMRYDPPSTPLERKGENSRFGLGRNPLSHWPVTLTSAEK